MSGWRTDMIAARDRNVADVSSTWPLSVLSDWWRTTIDYGWDGPDHRILDIDGVEARGYGSCGDAAASLLAAAKLQHLDAALCIEEPLNVPGYPNYRHVRVVVNGVAYDPYAFTRPRGLPVLCTIMERLP